MADPYQYIDSTGTIIPNTADILIGVQDEYKIAFGADLIVTPDTPQGLLASAEAIARTQVVNNNAALANQLNPNIAGGVFLDAIMALTLPSGRTPATQTVVSAVTLTGVAGTLIPIGTQAKTAAGDLFATLSAVTLNGGGTASVNFAAVEFGPISCAAFALSSIVTNVLGWETVSNTTAGVLGQNTQSDIAARALRNNTLAFQGVALPISITSALYNVAGVQSLWFQENIAGTTQTINGISMVRNSVYACVNGGSDLDVAAALLENKSSGCAWVGGTTVNLIEPASGQAYAVKFDRPTPIEILIRVTSPNGALSDIQTAILNYVAGGLNGQPGFVVGASVSPWEIAGAITTQYPSIILHKVEISYISPAYTRDVLAIGVNEVAFTNAGDITLVVA